MTNKGELTTEKKNRGKAPVDVATQETQAGKVVVTNPEGRQEEIPVKVVVKATEKAVTEDEKYTPQRQEVKTEQGKTPKAESVVTNKSDLPTGTKYSWKTPLFFAPPAEHETTLVEPFRVRSQDEVQDKAVVKAFTHAYYSPPQEHQANNDYCKKSDHQSRASNKGYYLSTSHITIKSQLN
ncbi:hypothetical protein CBF69_10725, partial [Lactobacillus taiwanensis]